MTPKVKKEIIDAQDSERDALIEIIKHLPEQVIKNVETIDRHQDLHKQNTKPDRRILNRIASVFGRPMFLYFQIVFFTIWIGCSNLAERKIIAKNFPLFDLHLHGLEIASLLISTEVLIDQTHQEKLRKEQSHLMLQLNLLTEQKIAKLISLVEELRTDLPNVKNRDDLEAEAMKQSIDPQAILEVIQHNSAHLQTISNSDS
ncbi:DUF1003 domain-containing protein [Chamaesiphon sp. VAR_48_metabat_135_sub]|uniref:DUF1003 domain-containing protein n=1 Tax=Chamaesiphon sp. VAR_48_metabat_135_sub TaxID=2964699 RepID=UPI00286AEDE0|nr:DUF1003 domain-containing protein [Chamaesiphon sp. VAR_48_metabat_135_sub]